MGLMKQNIKVLISPQLLVAFVAVFAGFAGLIGNGYSFSKTASAASGDSQLISVDYSSQLSPETGIQLSPKPLTFSVDCELMPCLALTFDDGPDPATTPVIMDALEKAGAKATFFVIGRHIAGHEALLRRMQADGFDIGNHSWSHPDFTKLSPEQMLDQINKTQDAMKVASVTPANIFRPPYGSQNEAVRQTLPIPIILWNVDPRDWAEKDPHHIADIVVSQAKPGAIIVMHDSKPTTAAAASEFINRLSQNYQLVTISQLVQLPAGARGSTVIY